MTRSLSSYDGYQGYLSALIVSGTTPEPAFLREYYRMLAAYFQNNGVYDYINTELRQVRIKDQDIKPLRNPANRVVEFYSAKMWPGKLPGAIEIDTDNDRIVEPIQQVWKWSNFSTRKQRMARWGAIYGDMFLKVNTTGDTVFFSMIKPENVTSMDLDNRGFITHIRLDVPVDEVMHTEIWDKSTQTVRIWRHKQGWDVKEERLGTPAVERFFQETHGEDFVPIVYQPWRDDGLSRGGGAYWHALDKIDEVNKSATRLSMIAFRHNRPTWAAMAGGTDEDGRPLPAPGLPLNSDDEFVLDDGEVLSIPGNGTLTPLVPKLNYKDHLAIVESQMSEIQQDLPELAYFDLRSMTEISGRAVRLLLDDAISRLMESRGNAEHVLQRADEMALSIGQNSGVFRGLGSFESGALEHRFEDRPVLPVDELERSQSLQALASVEGANLEEAAKSSGYTADEAADLFGTEEE